MILIYKGFTIILRNLSVSRKSCLNDQLWGGESGKNLKCKPTSYTISGFFELRVVLFQNSIYGLK